jgi:hypothetical protein
MRPRSAVTQLGVLQQRAAYDLRGCIHVSAIVKADDRFGRGADVRPAIASAGSSSSAVERSAAP